MNDMNHMINTPDRAEPVGEWELEPNEVTFVSHGYWCEVKRHPGLGHLCGYVLLGKKHPYWNLNQDFAVHGGLTYEDGIKVGFDCGHAGDMSPFIRTQFTRSNPGYKETYRNMAWVKREVENLAAQLRAVDPMEVPNE